MSQTDLDTVLGTIENPIRRRIIAKISHEPNYQLQLSKELGLSQQLVAKHLITMEEAGLVSTQLEDSPRGPQRKEYILRKSVSVTIDLAPSLFRARIFSFGNIPGTTVTDEKVQMMTQVGEQLRNQDAATSLGPLSEFVVQIDRKLKDMEEERAVLLYLRNLALKEAARASNFLGIADRKKVLRYILKEQRGEIEELSASLGLGQQTVGNILEEIEREFAVGR